MPAADAPLLRQQAVELGTLAFCSVSPTCSAEIRGLLTGQSEEILFPLAAVQN